MRALLVLVLLAGCDRVLGLGAIATRSDAGTTGDGKPTLDAPDGSTADAALTTCLSDTFSTATIDTALWSKFSTAPAPVPQVSEDSVTGVIDVTLQGEPPPTPPYNGLVSVNAFPFDDATFQVRLIALPNDINGDARLYIIANPTNEYFIKIRSSTLSLTTVLNSNQQTISAIIDPTMTRYARIRSEGGMIYIDVASSLGSWATLLQHVANVPTTTMSVGFAAGIDDTGTSSFQIVQFDDALVQSTGC